MSKWILRKAEAEGVVTLAPGTDSIRMHINGRNVFKTVLPKTVWRDVLSLMF